MVARNHYVDVGDPQRNSRMAICSCGWTATVPHADDLTDWEYHIELMAISSGHVYANAWRFVEETPGRG